MIQLRVQERTKKTYYWRIGRQKRKNINDFILTLEEENTERIGRITNY